MKEQFSRTAMLMGEEAVRKLQNSRVAVFGVGGVGGFAAEALARSGVGQLDLIDKDVVSASNINRQIIALTSTVGKPKAEVAAQRVRDINPDIQVTVHNCFFLPENAHQFDFSQYDYVVDAIDTVSGKLALVMQADRCGVPIISSMGAGNKLDPTRFEIADIFKTSVCPLARVMRKELKARGIKHLTVVYSKEEPIKPLSPAFDPDSNKPVPGSYACVPSVAGLILASHVIRELIQSPISDPNGRNLS